MFQELVDRGIIPDARTLATKESDYWKFELITNNNSYNTTAKYYFNTKTYVKLTVFSFMMLF